MPLLLDTNIAIWYLGQTKRLNSEIVQLIANPEHDVWISVVSVWEVAIKTAIGRIQFASMGFLEAAEKTPFAVLDIKAPHALAVEKLPRIHSDPFDRMLIAQAAVEGLRIVTADYRFGDYDCDPILV